MERVLTANIGAGRDPLDREGYERAGGYQAVRKALGELSPQDVRAQVERSGLRGRGGAGFPTGKKWGFMPPREETRGERFVIANADEMEPGTFKDRLLMEGDPHLLIEGLILAAYALQATTAYIFLRSEYGLCAERLERAIAQAYAGGWLGERILGTDFGLSMHLHRSAGRYICGEETALISALEGKRAIPRAKPPFPQLVGLFGKPTVVNNVETLCCVPHIVNRGAEWFKSLSRTDDPGTKIYGVSGKVNRPGAWELPMGTPIRELLEEHAGGMWPGHQARAVLPGGGSTDFVVEGDFDTPMDFDALQTLGSRLGTGTMVVLDDRSCPVGMVHNLERFFAQESCGWCTPCRDGLPYTERLLAALEDGTGRPGDLELLEMHTRFLGPGKTFCAHAPGAMEPLQSALHHFKDDFELHLRSRGCPYREPDGSAARPPTRIA